MDESVSMNDEIENTKLLKINDLTMTNEMSLVLKFLE